ncbi:hypothetical protein UlMin_037649 [Ulmus minor]
MEKQSEQLESHPKSTSRSAKTLVSTKQSHRLHNLHSRKRAFVEVHDDENDESESLSDIDDAEVMKYLNSKKEADYKRNIWEVMNNDYLKRRPQKRSKKAKKDVPTKKEVNVSTKMDEKSLRSKMNYEALKKLHEWDHNSDKEEDIDSAYHVDKQHTNEKLCSEAYSSGDNNDNEYEHENADDEVADATNDYYGITDLGDGDDDYNRYGYDGDFDFGEY